MLQQPFKIVFLPLIGSNYSPKHPFPAPGEGNSCSNPFQPDFAGNRTGILHGTHVGLQDPHNTWASYPFAPGYAAVGRVVAQGAGVPTTDPEALYFTDAPHAAQSLVKAEADKFLLPIPAGLSPERAIFCRLAAIAATGIALAPVSEGERVVMLGRGTDWQSRGAAFSPGGHAGGVR